MAFRASQLHSRDSGGDLPNRQQVHSPLALGPSAVYIHYAVIGGLVVCIFVFLFLSFFHMRMRKRRGLEPRRYHRWMDNRRRQPGLRPQPRRPTYEDTMRMQHESYNLPAWQQPPPPPAYNTDVPPAYLPTTKKAATEETVPVETTDLPSASTEAPFSSADLEAIDMTRPQPVYR